jgi:hypothetical protein
MREELLSLAYEYCRVKTRGRDGWVAGETEAGFARDQFDEVFDSDIENLMLEVIVLVLAAGREPPNVRQSGISRAQSLLKKVGATNLVGLLGEDDASELRHDLKILGLTSGERS